MERRLYDKVYRIRSTFVNMYVPCDGCKREGSRQRYDREQWPSLVKYVRGIEGVKKLTFEKCKLARLSQFALNNGYFWAGIAVGPLIFKG